MRGIFFRHVLRDICTSTAAVAVVLLVVLLAYQLAFILGRAADGQIPATIVLPLVGLSLRGNLTIILPFSVLLGTTLGLGRLYHDSEITAAQACGAGMRPLYSAAAVVTLLAAAVGAWSGFVDGPGAARQLVALRTDALRTAATRGLAPGQFRALGAGATLNFRAIDSDGALLEVFVERDLPPGADGRTRMQIVLADRARYDFSADSNVYVIRLTDGESHEGTPGAGNWRITQFREQTIRLPAPGATLPGRPRVDALSVAQLRASPDPRFRAELQWRISWVLITAVLGLLAVPLARLRPRQGRHARVVWAVLLFAVYAGLLSAGRTMLERGDTPLALGLWWVHGVALMLAAALLRGPAAAGAWMVRRRTRLAAGRRIQDSSLSGV
ncbi:MAG TPA: LPS export ABC transporter permease LptF [Steroidobacteraceae bacterium]|nr:LPS export ABC transporter permease LptF [Steroidobacteraceae bacterium]